MKLDVSSFVKAIAQLEEALKYCASDLAKQDEKLALHLRAGAIQAFEYTYDISFDMINRYLNMTESNPSLVVNLTFNEIIHTLFEKGIIKSDLNIWKEIRKARGVTIDTYDEEKAKEVFRIIPIFLNEAKYLLNHIKELKVTS